LGRNLGFNDVKPAKRGDEVKIMVLYGLPEVSTLKISRWLEVFGNILGDPIQETDQDNIESVQVQFKLVLEHHIPEFWPFMEQRHASFTQAYPGNVADATNKGTSRLDAQKHKLDGLNTSRSSWTLEPTKKNGSGPGSSLESPKGVDHQEILQQAKRSAE
jgi:hypothetical protein